jgi:hypothetical protein
MKNADVKVLKRLDAVLWGLWLIAPYFIFKAIKLTWSLPYNIDIIAQPAIVATYSIQGQIVIGLTIATNIAIFTFMVLLIHKLVRRFLKGEILISATLKTIKIMAYLFILMPFFSLLIYNFGLFMLHRFGDLKSWQPFYDLDIVGIATGLMFFALHILIQYALKLQKDVDLTI